MLRFPLTLAAVALAGPAFAQTTAAPAAPAPAPAAAAPATPNVTTGAQVIDTTGAAVGTIEGVTNGVATLSTGTTRASIPIGSFAAKDDKLVLGLTKAQVDAQGAPIAKAGSTPTATAAGTAATPTATTAAATPATGIAVGAQVNDQTGAKVGTVKAVNGDMVTVASDTASAQLPKASFAQSGGALVIGLSPAQFDAAAKAKGGAKAPAGKG